MKSLITVGLIMGVLLVMLAMPLPASAHGRFGGRVIVAPSFGWGGGYDPFFYEPYGYYGFYPPAYYDQGEIKLQTNVKDADVFINGAYAGKAGKLKSIWLRQNTYSLEIRVPGQTPFRERVYVIAGKSIKVQADFSTAPHS
jgi:hypothetical protein